MRYGLLTVGTLFLVPGMAVLAAGGDASQPSGQAYYTISVSPLTSVAPTFEASRSGDTEMVTVVGRIYISWQEQGAGGVQLDPVEVRADTLVLWRRAAGETLPSAGSMPTQVKEVSEIYVSGDVLLTQGQRMIRATELYYDLRNHRGLVKDAVMRTFEPTRDTAVYVRAKELRQVSAGRYEANDVSLTTDAFRTPQLSVEASKVSIIDRLREVEPGEPVPASSYSAMMKGVCLKYYGVTLLGLPAMRSDLVSPDVPLKSVHVGHDSTFGTSIETQWFLSRILGLREPQGTNSTLFLDYYDKRGPGGGVAVDYERENYFGHVLGYAINDHGQDRLGRTRKNIEVPEELRGRFAFQHRQFLPGHWQLTAEVSYLSDRNFLEQYYRSEFFAGKEPETLLHLKRIKDNTGLAFLGKARINDFLDDVEELPSAEYHWTGQSFFDDRLVFFSDNQVSRLRYRYDVDRPRGQEVPFTFTETRNEVDMPLRVGNSKIVPFVAGTFGYDDGQGFQARLDDTPVPSEDVVWIGEAGVRMSTQPFWRVYPGVESRLWDLHGLRHTIQPSVTAVSYLANDVVAEQRDTLDLGVLQRWQTKRGPAGRRRTVDWLRLDVDFVWVNNSSDEDFGPNRFIWDRPFVPLIDTTGGRVPPLDRRTTGMFGAQRDYTSVAATWRATETTSVLGDIYVDMPTGFVDQANVGFSHLVWPNLSYFIGSRYLRNVNNGLGQQGSNAVTFAITYRLDPRYTAVFSQQYDFDYEANIRSEMTLIRRYDRLNFALTVSVDDSLDEQRITFSLWPEGVPELAFGLRRYMGLGASEMMY
jgi:hypothetical protein